jgi:hypothetical protein
MNCAATIELKGLDAAKISLIDMRVTNSVGSALPAKIFKMSGDR